MYAYILLGASGEVSMKHFLHVRKLNLGWHLLAIVLLKIAVLYALWLAFIQPYQVKVNQDNLDCLYSSSSHCAHPISNQPVQNSKEKQP